VENNITGAGLQQVFRGGGAMTGDKVPIYIKKELYDKIKKIVEEGGFSSVEDFIEYLIEQAIEMGEGETEFTPEDKDKVSERLKDLGYI